ncbi:(deoxy)nucleoside triphosphate pyrophosphohydrolase [Salidesulfovibrio brasiliensis]|uniref:(deoxy)nucleoside triphosphate pyrophosphohydrolase n=1 Tax=Salidesulfovibrio brasiliensis TaxID=221711 RepID=UPI0006D09B3B|nr:(deoxy)nucleoside triphosphate pyrophosphohydrolase [Salidesulfovibrio brasiliensis]
MGRIIDVVAGILWRDGQYLAVDRPSGDWAGWWEFPGGKIESGESPDEALVRELDEELGVGVHEFQFWRELTHDYEHFSVRLYFYHVTGFRGEPSGLEGQNLRWLRPEHYDVVQFLPADEDIVVALKNGASPGNAAETPVEARPEKE